MSFETYFRACSYAMIACGVLALALAGGVGVWLGLAFAAVLAASWRLAGTSWQLSERAGLFVVLLALPLFYLDWRLQRAGASDGGAQVYAGVSALVHFTLVLSSIKLLQIKSDRDWLFLYLISFFEVLLAAGLSAGPSFLAALCLSLFAPLLAVIGFELRRSSRLAPAAESRLLVANDPKFLWRRGRGRNRKGARALRRLPAAALCLFVLIFGLALPIFFITPRSTEGALAMPGGSPSSGFVGFSDRVTLGDIGRLNESNQLVMRVRVEGPGASQPGGLRWRGVALDRFDGRHWFQSNDARATYPAAEGGDLFRLGTTEDLSRVTTQTFFVEPIDTPVLFAAPRAVALQGAFPYVRRDRDDALSTRPHAQERITYTVYSDTVEPTPERLRADRMPDPKGTTASLRRPVEDYLQLPSTLDTRVASLAWTVVRQAGARNTFDAARAIEAHLNRNAYGGDYRYSLTMRAAGPDPLSDFLFNVRAGHCEYFATAMAVMLRTLRIPARVVNGFQAGEYNAAADAYVVRQADAHSWVEVYFPESDAWVTFDPTPADGRAAGTSGGGLSGALRRYAGALELFWLPYVVAYHRRGQQTLARSVEERVSSSVRGASESADSLRARLSAWWAGRSGGTGPLAVLPSPLAVALGLFLLAAAVLLWLRRARLLELLRGMRRGKPDAAVVEFYRRMTEALAARGLRRRADETPLEFASALGTPEVLTITRAYNRIRFGAQHLNNAEAAEVERSLRRVEEKAGK